jgi:hypothetical protein
MSHKLGKSPCRQRMQLEHSTSNFPERRRPLRDGRTCIGNIKNKLSIAKETIWLLDQAQERRSLSNHEVEFRKRIKDIYLGLLEIEKIKAQRRARLTNVKFGDVISKLFFLRANGRKRNKHIQVLQIEQGLVFKHEDKEKEIEKHFDQVLGTKRARQASLNWEALNYPMFNLADLEADIMGDEVKAAIANILRENAPGPNGFIGAFYHKCWNILKRDVTTVVQQLSQLRGGTFNLLNTANIVLLPKKEEASQIRDYMPISLLHNLSKILKGHLGPCVDFGGLMTNN